MNWKFSVPLNNLKKKLGTTAIATLLCLCFLASDATASPVYQTTDQINLTMYVLVEGTGAKSFPLTLCNSSLSARQSYGCTYFPNDSVRQFPFSSNTININMEGQIVNNIQQGYLHNVVSQEMSEGSPLASYTAQAIAARTYAYHQTQGGTVTIDNSASKQVYLPHRFDGLGGVTPQLRKDKVHNAITFPGPLYMTPANSTEPIIAFFGQDNCTYTEDNSPPSYLKSVYDPISVKPTPCNNATYGTSNGGMSSAGASRWGYGNKSEVNQGNSWSVQWGRDPEIIAEDWQAGLLILTHYYTDIHIRNASGQIVTPEYRWNFLEVRWNGGSTIPSFIFPNTTQNVRVWIQNTGTRSWNNGGNSIAALGYYWEKDGTRLTNSTRVVVPALAEGQGDENDSVVLPIQVPSSFLPGDIVTLKIDMIKINDNPASFFRERENRAWYGLAYYCIVGISNTRDLVFDRPDFESIYVPIIFKNR